MYSEATNVCGTADARKMSATEAALGNLAMQQGELNGALYELRERLDAILSPPSPTKDGANSARPPGESRLVDAIMGAAEREIDALAVVRDILRRLTV